MNNQIKKYSPCINCNKAGHEQKYCNEPITSWGIILVKIPSGDNKIVHYNTDLKNYDGFDGFRACSFNDLNVVSNCMNNMRFLLVRRKHSLGFAEFIRGKYIIGNINGIRALFNQMVPDEINMIRTKSFEELWEYFWGENNAMEIINKKDFFESKDKFTKLKSKLSVEHDLDFYLDTAAPNYNLPEWGFPKGRKKRGETDLECALREFYEETGLGNDDIEILKNIMPIKEELIGTNGVKYRHIYFLAEMKNETTTPNIINNTKEHSEIGDIGFFKYDESMMLLRDYHIEKKMILQKVMNYYIELMKNNEKEKIWSVEESF